MAYNKGKEEKAWKRWKETEESSLRSLGASEECIDKLHSFDWEVFNSDRRYYQRKSDSEVDFRIIPSYQKFFDTDTVDSFLDDIDNPMIYSALVEADRISVCAIVLKTQGYTAREIAVQLHITEKAVYRRIDRLREKIREIL